jgi:nucleoside 2-deoxyribosyltransferase
MTAQQSCPLCDRSPVYIGGVANRDAYLCECPVCGRFIFTPEAAHALGTPAIKPKRYLLSAVTRRASDHRAPPVELLSTTLEDFLASAPKPRTPYDVLDPLLLAIHAATTDVSGYAAIPYDDYPLYVLRGVKQLGEFIKLLGELDLIDFQDEPADARFITRLTLNGWNRVGELRKAGRSSEQAFVAMSFAPELDAAWAEGFEPALRDAGWVPLRMDRLHHNERIDDRIVAEIRRSGLVVADFTGQRAGVYFEAGLAQGLGLPVIWTVRRPDLPNVHFDTRQYNHIDWVDPPDLRRRLYDRIVATVQPPRP